MDPQGSANDALIGHGLQPALPGAPQASVAR